MNRRDFLKAGAAGLAMSAMGGYVTGAEDRKPLRVGLIGTGWYGKSDLLRLIQVAPVDVVSLCDVDRRMLDEAGQIVAARQASRKAPRPFHDWRQMLADVLGRELLAVDTSNASARGAALLGGIASGIWADAQATASVAPHMHVAATPSTEHALAYNEAYAQYLRLSGATDASA